MRWGIGLLVVFVLCYGGVLQAKRCECPGRSYYCGEAVGKDAQTALEAAKKALATTLYTYIEHHSRKVLKKRGEKFKAEFSQETFTSTVLELGEVEQCRERVNGGERVVVYVAKDRYRDYIRKRFLSLVTELREGSFPLEELLKKRDQLKVIKVVGDAVGVDLDEEAYAKALSTVENKIRLAAERELRTELERLKLEVEECVEDKQVPYERKKRCVKEALRRIKDLRERFAKYGPREEILKESEAYLSQRLLELEKTTAGEVVVVVKRGEGAVFVDGTPYSGPIRDVEEKTYSFVIKGRSGYETRAFKVRLKKGERIIKEVSLWHLDRDFKKRQLKVGFLTQGSTERLELRKKAFSVGIFAPFVGIGFGYSLEDYGYETDLSLGVRIYKRNSSELLLLLGNDAVSIFGGVYAGYYGFNDKEERKYGYIRGFFGAGLHFSPWVAAELTALYQKPLKEEGESGFGVELGLSVFF